MSAQVLARGQVLGRTIESLLTNAATGSTGGYPMTNLVVAIAVVALPAIVACVWASYMLTRRPDSRVAQRIRVESGRQQDDG